MLFDPLLPSRRLVVNGSRRSNAARAFRTPESGRFVVRGGLNGGDAGHELMRDRRNERIGAGSNPAVACET